MLAAANSENPYEGAFASHFATQLQRWMGEYEQAAATADRGLNISEKHQFPYLEGFCRMSLGQARGQLGHAGEGLGLIRQAITELHRSESSSGITQEAACLAEALERAGAFVEALEAIEQALQANRQVQVYRPETLRLRGVIRRKLGQKELAEADFRGSIALAQTMSAKAWELRATLSFARLLRDTGQRDQARSMLADVYGWFTEGFDTADLIDAKALLDELGQ
jgi:tetratricopeptide (TPR) repeat protein